MAETGMIMNSLAFTCAMDELAKEVPDHMAFVVRWQEALWIKDIIKKVGGDPAKSLEGQRMDQKAIIKNDLEKLFGTYSDSDRISAPDEEGMSIVNPRSNKKEVYWIEASRRIPSFESMARVHTGARNTKTGRVIKNGSWTERSGYKGSMLNRQYFTTKTLLNDFIITIQSHIGKTKAAWAIGADFFAAKANGWVTSMYPDWIGQWKGWASSYAVKEDNIHVESMTGDVAAGTNVPWAKDPHNMLEATLETRRKDIEKGYALKRLEAILKSHQPSGVMAA